MSFQTTPIPSQPRLCLIGEADPFLARLLRRFVEKSGLRGQLVQTGEGLLDLVAQQPPALVILDPEMPGEVRGWEAYRRLKKSSATCHIPLIVCTWMKEDEARALLGELIVYLQKPELHYEDFCAALAAAGLPVSPGG